MNTVSNIFFVLLTSLYSGAGVMLMLRRLCSRSGQGLPDTPRATYELMGVPTAEISTIKQRPRPLPYNATHSLAAKFVSMVHACARHSPMRKTDRMS